MSSPKVIEYKLLTADNPTYLSLYVNNYLKKGWKIYGNPIITIAGEYSAMRVYAQVMVKYEEPVPPLPINPPLPIHTRPFPFISEQATANLFKPEEIKQMQDACNELIKVLEGKSTDYQYGGNKSTYVCNMPQRLKNHLKGLGYDFSPVETHRNEEYCYMYLA
jgi:hypothetical protein